MPDQQIPLTTVVQFTDPKTGYLTNEGRTTINALIERTGGPVGATVLFAGSSTWGDPVGAVLRNALATAPALPVGAAYSQAELTAIRDYVLVVAQHLGALIEDSKDVGVIG